MTDPEETIVALSSAYGPGARAVVRMTGPGVLTILGKLIDSAQESQFHPGIVNSVSFRWPDFHAPIPAEVYVWRGPRSYTGQDLIEIHLISSLPLVESLITRILSLGARAARGGEFTLRAFLAGKMDLPGAEAVRGIIDAASPEELKEALRQLAGGLSNPLQNLRDDLLNLMADVEAGLDFAEEDISFVEQKDFLDRVSKGLAQVINLRRQLNSRSLPETSFRVALAGRPNVGKSSLFNALTGQEALVSPVPGTTRDYLTHRMEVDGVFIELIDTAGEQQANGAIENQSQKLGREQADKADLVLLCIEAGSKLSASEGQLLSHRPATIVVATKCDLAVAPAGQLATSTRTREGIEGVKKLLADRARAQLRPAMAPSLSRCRHHVEGCLEHLRRVHEGALFQEAQEILALELRAALDDLGAMVGAIYTEDLLDRVFSRFCIGK